MLNNMKVNKKLVDGIYKGTLVSYKELPDTSELLVHYMVSDTLVSNTIAHTITTREGKVWHKLQDFIDMMGEYYYNPTPTEMLDYIIAEKIELNILIKSGIFAHLLPLELPSVPTETTISTEAPVRKARA